MTIMSPDFHPVVHGLSMRRAPRHNLVSSFNKHKYLLASVFQVLLEERGLGALTGPAVVLRVVHAHSQLEAEADESGNDFTTSSMMGELLGGESYEPRPFALSVLASLPSMAVSGPVASDLLCLAPLDLDRSCAFSSQEEIDHSILHLVWAPCDLEGTVLVLSCNAGDQFVLHMNVAGRWHRAQDGEAARALRRDVTSRKSKAMKHPGPVLGESLQEVYSSLDSVARRFDNIVVRAAVRELQNHEAIESDFRGIWA
ncbi:hypothetical protein [Hydrogenophaga sp. PBL-H3]|jgi:hypothetical protein|uniref:hypothetical protein n=1 Tax=Hydrogenophaga sp. PBL-H3 TaxID=434010 RepID=UPI00131F99C7|nr:hypothetical protein [Hydrogenophaga sp. PBL-H3]QHE78563.1 hypothetical protein F9Z45_20655 [Hydrogenophaga sp. PBL-H3]QHE82988.1 hypothetical protein F9Z44_20655 [Hydrogenophaga sp. PBL-H3]